VAPDPAVALAVAFGAAALGGGTTHAAGHLSPSPAPKPAAAAIGAEPASSPNSGAAPAAPPANAAVPLSRGTAAIENAAANVKRLTGASTDQVSGCSTAGSGVSCQVQWNYDGYVCTAQMLAYSASGSVKVKRDSGIRCRNLS
jgi:hypothetical protein